MAVARKKKKTSNRTTKSANARPAASTAPLEDEDIDLEETGEVTSGWKPQEAPEQTLRKRVGRRDRITAEGAELRPTMRDRFELRFGRGGLNAMEGLLTSLVRLVLMALTAVIAYVVVFMLALTLVPSLMVAIQQGTGVTADASIEAMIALWIAPSAVVLAVLVWLIVVGLRWLWKARGIVDARAQRWIRGEALYEKAESKGAEKTAPGKSAGKGR